MQCESQLDHARLRWWMSGRVLSLTHATASRLHDLGHTRAAHSSPSLWITSSPSLWSRCCRIFSRSGALFSGTRNGFDQLQWDEPAALVSVKFDHEHTVLKDRTGQRTPLSNLIRSLPVFHRKRLAQIAPGTTANGGVAQQLSRTRKRRHRPYLALARRVLIF